MATPTNEIWVNEDGESRKLQGVELAAFLKDREVSLAFGIELENMKKKKAATKQAVLDKLGITEEEAELLK